MEKSDFFSYSWTVDSTQTDITIIRIYGLNKDNENVCVIINDFTPFIFIELPERNTDNSLIGWNDSKALLLTSRIDFLMKEKKPLLKQLMFKKRLYYASKDNKGKPKLFPYLFCNFCSIEDIKQLSFKLRALLTITGLGTIKVKIHENNASPILQLTSLRKIPTAGWITFKGKRIIENKFTHCHHEFKVKWKDLENKNSDIVARPLLMAFDLEANSTDHNAFPKAEKDGDKIFQISCIFKRQGAKIETQEKYLLTLGETDEIEGVIVKSYKTEDNLLLGFTKLIQRKQPNLILGYNIFGFDLGYMIDRAKLLYCMYDFDQIGFDKDGHGREKSINWSSSAYKNQSFQFLDCEGRLFVDLLPLIKRDYKLSDYKLKTVSSHILKDMTKDPLDAKGIFKCYRLGMAGGKKGKKALNLVGVYCVKDSELVMRLFETTTAWIGLCELSKVCNTPIFSLYTQGQQIKIFSQVYSKCSHENRVVERDAYIVKDTDWYVGATVIDPEPGIYDKVIPFDFCLTGDTFITMADGTLKKLDTFSENEVVLGYDGKKFNKYHTIGKLQKKGKRQTVSIWLQDGSYVNATPDHNFLLDTGEWCRADKLKGQYVMAINNSEGREASSKKVIEVLENPELREVYDIEVENVHNFLANGIVSHNCSLYPTAIIAYNLCWSTLVEDDTIPDSDCFCISFDDHSSCIHDPKIIRKKEITEILKKKDIELKELRRLRDLKSNKERKEEFKAQIAEFIKGTKPLRDERTKLNKSKGKHIICCKRRYRWLKEPKGILPEILENLLNTRASTKNEMKKVKAQIKDLDKKDKDYTKTLEELSTYYDVLDQRQLALKISANSGYGITGARKGYLTCMPVAMCTTYMGRCAIEKAAKSIQEDHKGVLVYGDTDSNYISFPHLSTAPELYDYGVKVAKEVSNLFPKPMSLAFEEKIYWLFFILTKKRYMCKECDREGNFKRDKDGNIDISKKGVLLQRRDNCSFVRGIYKDVVMKVFNKENQEDILYGLIQEINKLCSGYYDHKNFVVTKSVGNVGELVPIPGVNEKTQKACYKIGDYTVRKLLPENKDEIKTILEKDNCDSVQEYYLHCLPAQAQLAEKMRDRGQPVSAGSRIEYIITTTGGHLAKQYLKVEDANYFSKHKGALMVDYLYYLKQLTNPMDQVLDIIFKDSKDKGFTMSQYNYRYKVREKMLNQLRELFTPRIEVIKDKKSKKSKKVILEDSDIEVDF